MRTTSLVPAILSCVLAACSTGRYGFYYSKDGLNEQEVGRLYKNVPAFSDPIQIAEFVVRLNLPKHGRLEFPTNKQQVVCQVLIDDLGKVEAILIQPPIEARIDCTVAELIRNSEFKAYVDSRTARREKYSLVLDFFIVDQRLQAVGFGEDGYSWYARRDRSDLKGCDEPPEMIGGPRALQSALTYPEVARKSGIQGTVAMEVVVDEWGRAASCKVLQSPGYGLDEAAVKAIRTVKWKPARTNGKPVACTLFIPVRFWVKEPPRDFWPR